MVTRLALTEMRMPKCTQLTSMSLPPAAAMSDSSTFLPSCLLPDGSSQDVLWDIYRPYILCRPAKLTEGQPHPDVIMESALLAAVSPPDIKYNHHLQVSRLS